MTKISDKTESQNHKNRNRKSNLCRKNILAATGVAVLAASSAVASLSGAALYGDVNIPNADKIFDNTATFAASVASIPTGILLTTSGITNRK